MVKVARMNFIAIVEVVLESVVLNNDLDRSARLRRNAKEEISLPCRMRICWIKLSKILPDGELRDQLKRIPVLLEKSSRLQPFQHLPLHRRRRIGLRGIRNAFIGQYGMVMVEHSSRSKVGTGTSRSL